MIITVEPVNMNVTFEQTGDLKRNGKAYLEFDGAAMTADVVYKWNKSMCTTKADTAAFRADITQHLKERESSWKCTVDNSDNTKVYPQKADFTFYGGLYRMVKLVTVPENHFCTGVCRK